MFYTPTMPNGGLMVARRALPDSHHVLRYVPQSKRVVDPDGNLGGPAPTAFALRVDDAGGLSVTEIEHFGEMSAASRVSALAAHRESLPSKTVRSNALCAWAQIERIKAAALTYEKHVRVVHDPVEGNPGHAEIRHFTDEDLDLLEFFSSDVFLNYEVVGSMELPPA